MTQQNKVLRARQCAEFLGIGLSTFWRWVHQGKIPRGTQLSARCTVWRFDVLEKFLSDKEAEAN